MTYKIEGDKLLFYSDEIIDKELLLKYNHIWFGYKFNQKLDFLTPNIKSITFIIHSGFSHPLDNLPNGLEYLELGMDYDLPLDFLPYSLKTLIFPAGNNYKYQFNNLPVGLKELDLGKDVCFICNKL